MSTAVIGFEHDGNEGKQLSQESVAWITKSSPSVDEFIGFSSEFCQQNLEESIDSSDSGLEIPSPKGRRRRSVCEVTVKSERRPSVFRDGIIELTKPPEIPEQPYVIGVEPNIEEEIEAPKIVITKEVQTLPENSEAPSFETPLDSDFTQNSE